MGDERQVCFFFFLSFSLVLCSVIKFFPIAVDLALIHGDTKAENSVILLMRPKEEG